MPMKREPASFPGEGRGGAHHRFDELSKADWADAYADLYRQVFGDESNAEEILADAEHRDDIRRIYAGEKPKKRPPVCSQAQRDFWHARSELWVQRGQAQKDYDLDQVRAISDQIKALEAAWNGPRY